MKDIVVIEKLINYGASRESKNNLGETPIDLLSAEDNKKLSELLEHQGSILSKKDVQAKLNQRRNTKKTAKYM